MQNQLLTIVIGLSLFLGACSSASDPTADLIKSGKISPSTAIDIATEGCTSSATVRVVRGQLDCDYLFILEDGRLLSPLNVEDIPFDLAMRQRISLSYDVVTPAGRGCLNASYVTVKCITKIKREDFDEDADSGQELRTR
ncbi:MAG: hypothetical protein NWR72_03845 [Bacteroidia bacterium]|nr:hypothetical protein [Bacteroidia bacterium]